MLANDEKAESYCDKMGYWIASGIVPLQNIIMELVACTQLAMHATVMSYSSCNYRWDVMSLEVMTLAF